MDQSKSRGKREVKGMSFKLNLFDALIILSAMLVGGVVLWQMLMTSTQGTTRTTTVQYTVVMRELMPGTDDYVVEGSQIYDAVKNYNIGTVVSSYSTKAEKQVLNHETRQYETAELESYIDIYVEVQADITETDSAILADGGFDLRVGELIYMRGAGYMATGHITQIDRLD